MNSERNIVFHGWVGGPCQEPVSKVLSIVKRSKSGFFEVIFDHRDGSEGGQVQVSRELLAELLEGDDGSICRVDACAACQEIPSSNVRCSSRIDIVALFSGESDMDGAEEALPVE